MRPDQEKQLRQMEEELEIMASRFGGDTQATARAILTEIDRARGELEAGTPQLADHFLRYYSARVDGVYGC